MKKIIFYISIILFGLLSITFSLASTDDMAAFSQKFLNNLASCTPYKEIRKIDTFDITIVQEIKGLKDNKCVYENYPINHRNKGYQCQYTEAQVLQIIQAMKKGNQKDKVSVYGINYESNAIDVLQTKFINDKNICKFFED